MYTIHMKDVLIKLREDNRYSQTAIAKMVGVSRQAYMKYETGEVEAPVEVIRKLKEIYNVSYEILIDNRVDLVSPEKFISYSNHSNNCDGLMVASPAPAYTASPQAVAKQTIQNSSLDEFATMLFSVAASLNNETKLTTEEKLTKFEVYTELAKAEREIANGDKGTDIDTFFKEFMGEKWSKKHIQ